MCVCVCVCVYRSICTHVSVCQCVSMCVSQHVSACACSSVCFAIQSAILILNFKHFVFDSYHYVICALRYLHSLLFHMFMKDIYQIQCIHSFVQGVVCQCQCVCVCVGGGGGGGGGGHVCAGTQKLLVVILEAEIL